MVTDDDEFARRLAVPFHGITKAPAQMRTEPPRSLVYGDEDWATTIG